MELKYFAATFGREEIFALDINAAEIRMQAVYY